MKNRSAKFYLQLNRVYKISNSFYMYIHFICLLVSEKQQFNHLVLLKTNLQTVSKIFAVVIANLCWCNSDKFYRLLTDIETGF